MNEPNLMATNQKIKFDYQLYMKAIKVIAKDILEKYDLEKENIGILGIARGGLPMLTSISHAINHREVAVMQIQVSNSDACHDFGEARLLNDNIDDKVDKYIVFEDIILKGRSTDAALEILKKKGKEVVAVYTLIIDEGFLDIDIKNNDVPINYCYKINRNDWVYFYWESDLNEELH